MQKIFNSKLFWWWVILFFLAIFVRFYNYPNFLYFINDQGRDALKLQSIVAGDLTLIGPTSGLAGFFLGPLWYYIGVPGYILSKASPYGISLWYIFIATLALPLFILLSRQLFAKKESWQILSFACLAFLPASINGATFIWNPLLSIPLMALSILALFRARNSRLYLALAFFSLGCVLHSEFAYAIFILPVIFVLIFWIRKKFSIIDYLIAGGAVVITLVPQILFELKNNFLMTKAMLQNLSSADGSVSFLSILLHRPQQLFNTTSELFFGHAQSSTIPALLVIAVVIYGIYRAWQKKNYQWQIIALIAVIPYCGYMLWCGNHGNFFSYYMTPHFIPLVPMFIFGLQELANNLKESKKPIINKMTVILLAIIFTFAYINFYGVIAVPDNQAGLKTIDLANLKTLNYYVADRENIITASRSALQSTVLTFTPNYLTAQYDFVMQWRAKSQNLPIPNTQIHDDDSLVYIIVEPDKEIPEKRFTPWYARVQTGRLRLRSEKVGVLLLETWINKELATQSNLPIYETSIREQMCW